MKRYIFFILIFCLIQSCVSIQNNNNNLTPLFFYLEIEQTIYPTTPKQHTFVISGKELFVLERCIAEGGYLEIKKIYSRKIKDIEKLKVIYNIAEKLFILKDEYIVGALDGIDWKIKLFYGDRSKFISISNTSINEINDLFSEINSIIPHKQPLLSVW